MRRWVVLGAGGMVGQEVCDLLHGRGEDVLALQRADLDITREGALRGVLTSRDVVVNTAAWTDVDSAEERAAEALVVNGTAVRHVAEEVGRAGAWLVHLSTDYVFDGTASTPYDEDAEPAPRTAYGRSKLAGERAVREILPARHHLLRTAWVYGGRGRNFVRTMLSLAARREFIDVVDDQRGQPTWVADLARRIVEVVERDLPAGTYHATNAGDSTWCGLARAAFAEAGLDPGRIRPVTSAEFAGAALRPAYSVLGHGRWGAVGMSPMRPWREALAQAMPSITPA